MIKVLAAEMSDPSRLRRGKQYAKDGSVLDIEIEPGIVTCEIQGTRSTPYVATIEVTAGSGMPLRRDVTTTCSCPDDDNWDGFACKHAVAAMFVLSDELLLEPELLDLWRGGQPATDRDASPTSATSPTPATSPAPVRSGRHLRVVGDDERAAVVEPGRSNRLQGLLDVPAGAQLPDIPRITRPEPIEPADRLLATALREALADLRLDWD
jgi:uncharacterized Zn finger protein